MLHKKYLSPALAACMAAMAATLPQPSTATRECPTPDALSGATGMVATTAADEDDLTGYFLKRLEGDSTDFGRGRTLKAKAIDDTRRAVWQAWCEANKQLGGAKLSALRPLAEGAADSWQLPEQLEPKAVMPYYWGSKGEKPAEGYPLFLYLHGSGSKDKEWATGLRLCNAFEDAPSAYFIPQIPNEGGYYRWWQRAKQYAWEKLLREALASGEVDANRVYFFGISEGGYGSQRLASFYADYLAAAGPMAGGEPLKNAPAENCGNIGFSLLTGADDRGFYRNKLTGYVKEAFDSLRQAEPGRFAHRIELIPGRGHSIDYSPTTPWLRQFVRNPYPKVVTWEDYDMDGRYRPGFYNIAVNKRKGDGARTYYEMRIEGNEIDLNISDVTYRTTETDPHWGIELRFSRAYRPATGGNVTLYLCDELVDLSQKVTLRVNGKEVFRGRVKPNLRHMVNSCLTFFDPQRIYPAAIEVAY